MPMNFAQAVCDRLKDIEAATVVVNDRTTHDTTPNGHATNVQPERCLVVAATPDAGLFLKRLKDGQEVSFQWHAVGSLLIVDR